MAARVIDFETYYTKDYSLSKMQTDEYILDPRFQIILVAVDDKWFSGTHTEIANFIRINTDPENDTFIAHNAIFDGFILTQILGIRPARWVDTLGMARAVLPELKSHGLAALAKYYDLVDKGTYVAGAIGKRREDLSFADISAYAAYCLHDVALTRALYDKLSPFFPPQELAILDMTVRMFTEPKLLLDAEALDAHHKAEIARKEELLTKCTADKSQLMSNPKLAEQLRALGVEPPMKISGRTGKETFAFAKADAAFTALLEHEDPNVQALVAARLGVKSTTAETRALRMLNTAQRGTGRFPVALNYWGAKTTGRLCLTGDTAIFVLRDGEILSILLPELRPEDLVWDGAFFVSHGGLADRGEQEIISYGGITGTPDHRVYCEEISEAIELRTAAERNYTLKTASTPPEYEVDTTCTIRFRSR